MPSANVRPPFDRFLATRRGVAGLCVDLVAQDPGAAERARSRATLADPGDLHDPEGVSVVYLMAAAIFQL